MFSGLTRTISSPTLHIFLALTVFLFFGFSAHAITLDKFEGNPDSQNLIAVGVGSSDSSVASDTSAVGGTRSAEILSTGGGALRFFAGSNFMEHSQGASNTGITKVIYDGDSTVGLTNQNGLGDGVTGLDFTEDGGTALMFEIISFDYPNSNPLDIVVRVYDASDDTGTVYSEGKITLNASLSNHVEQLDYSNPGDPGSGFPDPGLGGHADFTNVGAVEVLINGISVANDLEIKYLKTNGRCEHVPVNGHVLDACGVCDGPGTDSDGDGVADCNEQCPNDPNKTDPGICGCGAEDIDSDGDGVVDCQEQCIDDPEKENPGICGCGVADTDTDGDGTPDCNDECYQNAETLIPGECGCDPSVVTDRCGVCGGDGESCLDCQDFDITQTQFSLDGVAKDQEKLIRRILKRLRKLDKTARTKNYIERMQVLAHELQDRNWNLSWVMESVFSTCTNTFCVNASNEPVLAEYREHLVELRDIAVDAIKRVRRAMKRSGKFRRGPLRKSTNKNDELFSQGEALADTVPVNISTC